MMLFNDADYWKLYELFDSGYEGYRPHIVELPNGDGKPDADKRYLHVALKYNPPDWAKAYLARAHFEACRVAEALNVPAQFYPKVENGTLRVLEYPAGSGSAEHTDFDLLTVHCYRSERAPFLLLEDVDPRAAAIDPDVHLGELAELVGVGYATPHAVASRRYSQRAIVYFAMPDPRACLLNGMRVSEWLDERMSRSRSYT